MPPTRIAGFITKIYVGPLPSLFARTKAGIVELLHRVEYGQDGIEMSGVVPSEILTIPGKSNVALKG